MEKEYDMNLYREIENTIRQQEEILHVSTDVTVEDVRHTIRIVMRNNPDIFWFAFQWDFSEATGSLSFRYVFSQSKVRKIKNQIDEVIDLDFQIAYVRTLSSIEKVVYVYKWIVTYCNYNLNSAFNQSIYSVFILRNSVCMGYAKAAQYLLKLLDVECCLVFGQLIGSEDYSRHCWNLVKINNTYYHVDVCLGDALLNSIIFKTGIHDIWELGGINYNFFCVSTDEIIKSRTIEDMGDLPLSVNSLKREQIVELSKHQLKTRESKKGVLLSNKGTTSDIYLCSRNKNLVLKCYRDVSTGQCVKEYRFMDRLRNSPHLLHVNDDFSDISDGIIALEQAVPVSELLLSPDNSFSLKEALTMIRDIALAIDECYWNSVYYRDIHMNNIYKTKEGRYKLADFGSCAWAIQTDSLMIKETVEGSPWFMSPEYHNSGVYYMSSATYSLSLLLYFLLNDQTPPFWMEFYDERAYKKRYEGAEIPSLNLYFDDDVNQKINRFLMKGVSFDERFRYRGIQEYVSVIEEIICYLGKRDYTLLLTGYDSRRFSKTFFPGKTEKRFPENPDVEETIVGTVQIQDPIPATITCPNCNFKYSVEIAKSLYESRIKPILCIDSANGGLCLIREDTDYVKCPNCSFEVTIGECLKEEKIALPSSNHVHHRDTFSTTKVHAFTFSPNYRFSSYKDRATSTDRNPDFSTTVVAFNPHNCKNTEKERKSSLWKKLFGPKKKEIIVQDNVYSSIFAPAEVRRKSHMLVQVYLHLYEETEKVKALAQESDKNAERRDYIPLQCKLKKGDKVDVLLNIYGETLLMSKRSYVIWSGHFVKCSFDCSDVLRDIDVDELSCVAMLTVNGVPVGEMRFITRIADAPRRLNPEIIAHKYSKVFISYSHHDESKVKFLHEGLELGSVPHFFDRSYLKPGDVFPQKIQDYINSADLFILCWSENASKSEYVQKERMQALERAFPQVQPEQEAKLRIYPMSIEPRAELPGDMKENYHFGEI